MAFDLVVRGEPATFATKGEVPWKALLQEALKAGSPHTPWHEVTLAFTVAASTRNGQPFDLDNLCEPVFAVLANAGWLDGGRTGLTRWYATKATGASGGVTVRGAVASEVVPAGHPGPIYKGALPRSGTDEAFATWVAQELPTFAKSGWRGGPIGIGLRFGAGRLNIGDISTGRVKNLIDGMWPLLGGRAGAPEDWKVEALLVERGVSGLKDDEVQVMVWDPTCGT